MAERLREIAMADDLWPHARANAARYGVPALVHPDDPMLKFLLSAIPHRDDAVQRYFYDGNASARKVADLVYGRLGLPWDQRLTFFEFAAGYGMVTRHLPLFFPACDIVSCDIHDDAVDFLREELGVRAVRSESVPERFTIEEKADIVFALSFFSHVPPETFGRWLARFYDGVKPGGYLIFTTHGRRAIKKSELADDIPDEGYHFEPISEQAALDPNDYGAMFVTADWVIGEIWKRTKAPLAFYREAYWWEHQDVYIVAKR